MWLLEMLKLHKRLACKGHMIFLLITQASTQYVLTQPMGLRKGFQEEGLPKWSWDKGKILRRGYSRARELQGIWFWPQRAVRPGWAELQPQAAESWASLRRKLPEPTFQSSMTHEPGKFCQARLLSLVLDTLWKALRAAALKGAGRVDRCNTHLVGTSPSSSPYILSSVSSRKQCNPQGPANPERGNHALLH